MDDPSRPDSMEDALPERCFGWWDMFVHPNVDPRTDGGIENTEHAIFVGSSTTVGSR